MEQIAERKYAQGTVEDLLQLNDWKFRDFFLVVLITQVLLVGCAVSAAMGISIPALPQLAGFIYITFLPGFVILRIMKMHRLGPSISILYAIGASLIFSMFLGFFINLGLPVIGISRPITLMPLFITWAVILGILCFLAYIRDKDYFGFTGWNFSEILWPVVFFAILLPLLAVLGAETVNFLDSNVVLLGLIILIVVVAVVLIMGKLIPVGYYPLMIFSIALALLWHDSLVSTHLTGYDIFSEYYFSNQVLVNGIWDQQIPSSYNAMLSVSILPAVYSIFLNIPGEWIFKIVYPFLYAAMPLALFMVYSKQLSRNQAIGAVFFVVAIYVFYLVMPSLARQMIGQLFFVMMIFLLLDDQPSLGKKALFILFGAGIVVSHYSLSYIFLSFLILSLIFSSVLRKRHFHLTIFSVILFGVVALAWNIFLSNSSPFLSIIDVGKRIYENAIGSFFDLFSRDVAPFLTSTSPNGIHLLNRFVHYVLLLFTVIGANRLLPGRPNKFSTAYLGFIVGSYAMLGASVIVPYFAASLGIERIFHMSIMILAPFTVLGINDTVSLLHRMLKYRDYKIFPSLGKISLSILLGLFFLFNTDFIWVLIGDPLVQSLPLNYGALAHNSQNIDTKRKIMLRYICPADQEVLASRWMVGNMDRSLGVYAVFYDIRVPALSAYGMLSDNQTGIISLDEPNDGIQQGYIYLGYANVVYGYGVTFLGVERSSEYWDIDELNPVLDQYPKIYGNGAAEIYLNPKH